MKLIHHSLLFICWSVFSNLLVNTQVIHGRAIYVSDGDTFRFITADSNKLQVRISGIDCPERLQPFGLEAKEFVVNLILHKEISIDIKKTDRYGRKVASVCINGKNLAAELLKNGLAWHYSMYSNDLKYARFEQKARKKKIGLWTNANPIPPWEFRKNKKNIKTKI